MSFVAITVTILATHIHYILQCIRHTNIPPHKQGKLILSDYIFTHKHRYCFWNNAYV